MNWDKYYAARIEEVRLKKKNRKTAQKEPIYTEPVRKKIAVKLKLFRHFRLFYFTARIYVL